LSTDDGNEVVVSENYQKRTTNVHGNFSQ